jgi:crotonobetainyl-CoA:carnitine CoA-transferase CaiB-like acyl-CoA transferase
MTSPADALSQLWSLTGLPAAACSAVTLTGKEPALPSSFRIGTAAQASVAASALMAAEIHRLRTSRPQEVAVDMRDATILFRSERYLGLNGAPLPEPVDAIFGLFQCGDGRWVRLHTNFPHHRDGVLRALGGVAHDRAAVAEALRSWTAEAFEDVCAAAGLVVTMARSFAEWDAHPHGRVAAEIPPLVIERIGDAPPQPLGPGHRPLAGVRVLELTRAVAGPVAGRALASHGADVMLITASHLPSILLLAVDTGRGKLSARLDLRDLAARETLRDLVRGADIFLQGYRPGAVAGHGFSPDELAGLRPGIIFVTLSAYGHIGPWSDRRGFDSLVQNANGMNIAEAEAAGAPRPQPLPCQANDHASGYLLALGAMAALHRRAVEGGSWHVRVGLAPTAHWIRNLGRLADGLAAADPSRSDVTDRLEETESGFGRLTVVRDAVRMSLTPPSWERPSVPLGTHSPNWLM